jgi:hypothetical protein
MSPSPPDLGPPPTDWPRIGVGEKTTRSHLTTIRQTWDDRPLRELHGDLRVEEPRRPELIAAVEQQIIRCELYELMGSNITTLAYIYAGDRLLMTTESRDVKLNDVEDQPLEVGSGYSRRVITMWNASLRDSEVATIKDVLDWARTVDATYMATRPNIVINVIGTSGPCESCQERLTNMANDLLNYWHEQTGIAINELPQLEVWSYYGNPSKEFKRGQYWVTNGWASDGQQQRLAFRNKAGRDQGVRQHQVAKTGGPPRTDTDPSQYRV